MKEIDKDTRIVLEECIEFIDALDFTSLYDQLNKHPDMFIIPKVTEALISADINPLEYLDEIPVKYLYFTNIDSVLIPNHIKRINKGAFGICNNLTDVKIPKSVERIDDLAFISCSRLKKVIIENSQCTIGLKAFADCNSALTFYVDITSQLAQELKQSFRVKDIDQCNNDDI